MTTTREVADRFLARIGALRDAGVDMTVFDTPSGFARGVGTSRRSLLHIESPFSCPSGRDVDGDTVQMSWVDALATNCCDCVTEPTVGVPKAARVCLDVIEDALVAVRKLERVLDDPDEHRWVLVADAVRRERQLRALPSSGVPFAGADAARATLAGTLERLATLLERIEVVCRRWRTDPGGRAALRWWRYNDSDARASVGGALHSAVLSGRSRRELDVDGVDVDALDARVDRAVAAALLESDPATWPLLVTRVEHGPAAVAATQFAVAVSPGPDPDGRYVTVVRCPPEVADQIDDRWRSDVGTTFQRLDANLSEPGCRLFLEMWDHSVDTVADTAAAVLLAE